MYTRMNIIKYETRGTMMAWLTVFDSKFCENFIYVIWFMTFGVGGTKIRGFSTGGDSCWTKPGKSSSW